MAETESSPVQDMDGGVHSSEVDPKYLLGQLSTARKEINNLRQQVKNLRHILDKDVDGIKQAIGTYAIKGNASSIENCVPATNDNGGEAGSSRQSDDFLKLKPIGIIKTGFPSKRGTPRQPTICKTACGKVSLFNTIFTNPEHALIGLQDFSHMWILFHFHRNDSTHVRAKVAPPRLNGARTGVFSTRSPHRPCPIGLSLVKIVKIDSHDIYFEGVDMVDQTPVLDIKPYIPQYDNPLHIEKIITSRATREDASNGSDYPADSAQDEQQDETTLVVDSSSLVLNLDFNGEARDEILWDCCRSSSSSVEANGESCSRVASTSRDEEIALRLQAEEFEASPNFEAADYGPPSYFSPPALNNAEGNGLAVTSTAAGIGNHAIIDNAAQNLERNFGSLVLEPRNSAAPARNTGSVTAAHAPNMGPRVQQQQQQQEEDYASESEMPRNSRLLDGADGPSTVCGTDMDLIHRRALNARPDNSPVRMGVREAPDGEEGLESQPLTPSQTLANIHGITSSAATSFEAANSGSHSADSRETIIRGQMSNFRSDSGSFEVRVPEWISRPRTNALSVIFNERALAQLNEILDGKADEQKSAIESVLGQDPRSVYLRQRWGNQFYTFLIHDLHISCRFDDNRGVVTVFQVRHAGRTCECGEPEWQCLGHSPLS